MRVRRYALGDLKLFSEIEVPPPDRSDWDVLRELFQRVRDLSDDARLTGSQQGVNRPVHIQQVGTPGSP